jgi:putative aminopeptidase FrvX
VASAPLTESAEQAKIPFTVEAAPRETSTDADAIFNAHRGIATALVSVTCRYMHSPNELVALADLERTAELLASFARRVTAQTDFVPR